MARTPRRSVFVGFLAATAVIAVLLFLVDVGAVGAALGRADPALFGLVVGLALVWLLAWGLTLRTVLASLAVAISVRSSFTVYTAAVFANNVTPFGFAGGEAVTALIIATVTDTRYETGLAGIASVDVLNAVSSFALIVLGAGVYTSSVALGPGLRPALGSGLAMVAAIVVVATLAWRSRAAIIDRVAGPLASVADRVGGRFVDGDTVETSDVADRLRRFVAHVERVGADRSRLAVALTLSMAGWVVQAVALTVAFGALGHAIPVALALVVIPIANLAGMTPLPGGLGGIEAGFVALLVPATGIEAAVVTAAVLLFRAAIYWLPVVIGGGIATTIGIRFLT